MSDLEDPEEVEGSDEEEIDTDNQIIGKKQQISYRGGRRAEDEE